MFYLSHTHYEMQSAVILNRKIFDRIICVGPLVHRQASCTIEVYAEVMISQMVEVVDVVVVEGGGGSDGRRW